MVENSNNTAVVDASFVLARLFLDENTPEVRQSFELLAQGSLKMYAPILLIYEVGNALKSATLRKRLGTDQAKNLYQNFLLLPITYVDIEPANVLELSINENLSFYDASYVLLARKRVSLLLTLDKRLVQLM